MKKYLPIVLALLIITAFAVTGCSSEKSEIVATVNGEEITKEQFYDALVENNGSLVLEQLISTSVVSQEAKKQNVTVTDQEIQDKIDQIIEENYYGSQEYFEQALLQSGWTEETLKENLRIDLLLTALVRNKIDVTDEEVQQYYNDNQDQFDIPHQVHARHILVETKEEADDILQKLQSGEDFAALAKEHSIDPGSKDTGGDLGMFGKGEMVEEFEAAAFNSPVGLYETPVETEHGFHIIEVLEIQEAREVEFAEVQDDVKQKLIDETVQGKLQEEYNALLDGADIERLL